MGRELALGQEVGTPEIEDLIAIHHPAFAIHGQHAVGVAIKGKAHAGALIQHRLAQLVQMGTAAIDIDALPIGRAMQHRQIGSQGLKHRFPAGGRGAPAQIQNNLAALQPAPHHARYERPLVVGQ